jgi:hypothetical protein
MLYKLSYGPMDALIAALAKLRSAISVMETSDLQPLLTSICGATSEATLFLEMAQDNLPREQI